MDNEESSAEHPHMATAVVDAMDEGHVRHEIEADPDLILSECDSIFPGRRVFYVACATREAASRFESRWNEKFYHEHFGFFDRFVG